MARSTVYNNIVTEELYEKVNEDNKELLEEFTEYLQSIGRSELTIKGYNSDIKIYFIWNLKKGKNKDFTDITKRDVMRYQSWLIGELELSSSRVRRLRAAISSMSNFIENVLDDDFPDFRNIVNKIPAPDNRPVRPKTVFEEEELKELLDKLTKEEQYQEACALALAMYSGARKAELGRFKVDYFKPEYIVHGSLYKSPEKVLSKGRGGKMSTKYVLANDFQPYLDNWLKDREKQGIDNEYLFVTKEDGEWIQAKISTFDSWAIRFNEMIDKHFYWHANRHFFTSSLIRENIPAEVIRDIIDWSTTDMVSLYNDNGIDDELGKYFGANGIKQVEKKSLSDL